MNATVNIVCYKSKTLANGEHPLMIRVAKNSKTKFKSLGISVHPDHWDFQKNRPKNDCPNKELILKIILEKEVEFQNEILELTAMKKEYTASSLIASKTNQITAKSVGDFFEEIINQFKKDNRIGNANVFRYTSNSIKRFCGNDLDFPFHNIDTQWLNKYEQWLRNNNCSEVTMSVYFRTLRTAYKRAIDAKCTLKSSYPFDEYKISKFDTKTQKRAIPKEAIKKIMVVDLSKEKFYMQFSRDVFIFSYLCGGVNITDIASLKLANLIEKKLVYIRKKTKKKISTPLSDEALQIIQKYSAGKTKPNDYIFPVLNDAVHKTETQKSNRIHKVMGTVNRMLKKIAKLSGIKANLRIYSLMM